jgi:hypothetical protein
MKRGFYAVALTAGPIGLAILDHGLRGGATAA